MITSTIAMRQNCYFVFQCKDPLLSSNIQLEVSPGRLRFTGKHQKYYDDTGRQVVLEGLPKKGLGCEVLNLDGLMTIVKRHSHVNVLVNGKSIDLNVDKEVKVGDRVIIADRYFFLLEDGGNFKKRKAAMKKRKQSHHLQKEQLHHHLLVVVEVHHQQNELLPQKKWLLQQLKVVVKKLLLEVTTMNYTQIC